MRPLTLLSKPVVFEKFFIHSDNNFVCVKNLSCHLSDGGGTQEVEKFFGQVDPVRWIVPDNPPVGRHD